MTRYIDADKLRFEIKNMGLFETAKFIKTFPSEDVKPVIHAHWVKDDNNQCYCSACMDDHHRPMFFTPHPQWRYCPWCGAKMDEVE